MHFDSFKGAMMSKAVLDADEILQHASSVVHQMAMKSSRTGT
jgi:hypothetical protein